MSRNTLIIGAVGSVVAVCLVCSACLLFIALVPTCDAQQFISKSTPVWQRFFDADKRAGATARIALTTVTGEMQAARRDFADISYPSCASNYRSAAIYAMDSEINVYLAFMAQESDAIVGVRSNTAKDAIDKAVSELDKLKKSQTTFPFSVR